MAIRVDHPVHVVVEDHRDVVVARVVERRRRSGDARRGDRRDEGGRWESLARDLLLERSEKNHAESHGAAGEYAKSAQAIRSHWYSVKRTGCIVLFHR